MSISIVDVKVLELLGTEATSTHVQLSVDAAVVGNPPVPGPALKGAFLAPNVLEVTPTGTFDEPLEALAGLAAEEGKVWIVTALTDVPGVTFTPGQTLQAASFGPDRLFIELPG